MKYHPDFHHRRSIRLKGYDYEQAGAYFVTIGTQERARLFGVIREGEMWLNDAGRMIEQGWFELNRKFLMAETDEFVIMLNHFHGIVVITDVPVGADLRVGPVPDAHAAHQGAHAGAPLPIDRTGPDAGTNPGARWGAPMCAPASAPLQALIQWFKTMTTNEYIRGVKTASWPSFNGRLWQRNYYEHIIRNDESLNRIRQYILDNPARWALDRENPASTNPEAENSW